MGRVINHILLATDFSDHAGRARDYAYFLATEWKTRLTVLHVLEFQPGMDPDMPVNRMYLDYERQQAEKHLAAMTDTAFGGGMLMQTRLVTGIPSVVIDREADAAGADLIVLGTHGRTGLPHVLLGSTAERVVASAGCPVLTVRPIPEGHAASTDDPAAQRMRRLLVPLDFYDGSLEALEYAVQIAKHFGASITLMHVVEPVSYGLDFTLMPVVQGPAARTKVEGRLAQLAAPLAAQGLTTHCVVHGGTPADSILDWTGKQAYDLIVMGTHGRRGLSHFASGSVAEAVLRRSPCPVLTVKSPKYRRAGESPSE